MWGYRWGVRFFTRADLALAALVAVMACLEVALGGVEAQRPAIAGALGVIAAAVVLLRSAQPLACLAAMVVLVVVAELPATGRALTGALMVGSLLALGSVGRHCPDRSSIPAVGMTVGVFVVTAAFNLRPWDVVLSLLLCAAAWGAGRVLRREAAQIAALQSLAEDLEVQRASRTREAVQAEKMRLARELHDTIAHTVSVMTLQVGGARRLLDSDADRARERDVLLDVEGLGRQAVAELHHLLGVLRSPDDDGALTTAEAPVDPQPRLADLTHLAARVRAAGVPVDLSFEGPPRPLPAGVELAGYRVVQEALTNVLKHSNGSSARVTVRYSSTGISLLIEDNGTSRPVEVAGTPGLGLAGMRERVALCGGRVEAGPLPQHGFAVRATLPLPGAPGP